MRTVLLLTFLTGTVLAQTDSLRIHWGQRVNDFSVGLSVSNATFAMDQPILVEVHLRNDASVPRSIAVIPQRYLLSFVATDAARKLVEPQKVDGYDGSVAGLDLSPGQIRTEAVDLRNYLHLTKSGKYVVTAKWLVTYEIIPNSDNVVIDVLNGTNQPGEQVLAVPNAGTTLVPQVAPGGTPPEAFSNPAANAVSSTDSKSASEAGASAAQRTQPVIVGRFWTGVLFVLVGLLAVILWRAARRKPQA
jgi:hypothetical protein